jgi:glycosyltransferase involved in cell wall biosynthesis
LARLRQDDWVICVSQSTRNDFCQYTGFDPSQVIVVYSAASPQVFYPCTNVNELERVRRKYGIPDGSYVLTLNTLEPRKNVQQVIASFAHLVEEEQIKDLSLVLVGAKGWKYEGILETISGCRAARDRITLTDYVPDQDLSALYTGALVFVYPSLYEGFGLPPLEAMQCGAPVITSNTSSLPEVVGDAGIMIDPTDTDALCQSMLDIYHKPCLRTNLSRNSLERARQFSWERCTTETIAAYRQSLTV